MTLKKVCIVGAGPSGLISLKLCLEHKDILEPYCFEQFDTIGGIWGYTPNPNDDEFEIPASSPVFQNLRTNLPFQLMQFQDFECDFDLVNKPENSFPKHELILQYLIKFKEFFGLEPYIKLRHQVVKIDFVDDRWRVVVRNLRASQRESNMYDFVIICTGHYSVPNIPRYRNMEDFQGTLIHSLKYRSPEEYTDQRVLLVGYGSSMLDILYEILSVAKSVTISVKFPEKVTGSLKKDVVTRPFIDSFENDYKVRFINGTEGEFDKIIFCTGYLYSLPFLKPSCEIEVIVGARVQYLYKQMINIKHPTMCFIGIPQRTIMFPLFQLQAKCYLKVMVGKLTLPPQEKMMKSWKKDTERIKSLGVPLDQYHFFPNHDEMINHMQDLASTFETEPIKKVLLDIYVFSDWHLRNDYENLRRHVIKVIDEDRFEYYLTDEK